MAGAPSRALPQRLLQGPSRAQLRLAVVKKRPEDSPLGDRQDFSFCEVLRADPESDSTRDRLG
eukprot:1942085-Alexandrium_andersonii.AAC.1